VSLSERVAVHAPLVVVSGMTSAAAGLAAVAVSTRYLGATVYGSLTIAMLSISLASVFTDSGLCPLQRGAASNVGLGRAPSK